jgi:hypothetical protein
MVPPTDAHHVVLPSGEAYIWLPHADIVAQKVVGVLSLPILEAVGAAFQDHLRPGTRLRFFDDYSQVTTYTRDAREYATAFVLAFTSSISALHILHASKHLALGISSLKHRVGDELVHTYSDRASFLRAFAQALDDAPPPELGLSP